MCYEFLYILFHFYFASLNLNNYFCYLNSIMFATWIHLHYIGILKGILPVLFSFYFNISLCTLHTN